MNRRKFLVHSVGGLTVLSLAPLYSFAANANSPVKAKKLSLANSQALLTIGYGPRAPGYSGPDKEAIELPSMLYLWSENNREFRIPVPFLVHSIAQNPVAKEMVLLIPKWGRRTVEVNLLQGKITRTFLAKDNVRFFGHGYYSENGKTVFLSETDDKENKSYLSLWEGDKKVQQIRRIETFGTRVHECIPSRDGKHIVACNTGIRQQNKSSSIVWLDKDSYKLSHQIFFEGDGPSHILETSDGHFIYGGGFSSKELLSPTSVCGSITPDKKHLPLNLPEEQKKYFYGETLSLTANEKNKHALVTVTPADSVFIFDYTTGKFVHRIDVKLTTGIHISEDRSKFYVTSRVNSSLLVYDSTSFQLLETIPVPEAPGWSSHLNRLSSLKV